MACTFIKRYCNRYLETVLNGDCNIYRTMYVSPCAYRKFGVVKSINFMLVPKKNIGAL